MYKALHDTIRDSEKLAELSDFAYRLWSMGLVASDVVGRITAKPRKFWAEAMPMTPYDEDKYDAAILELVKARLIHLYEVDGKRFMVFHEHEDYNKSQKNLKHQNKSKCPPPPPSLCFCVVYTKFEEKSVSTDTDIPQKPVSTDTGGGVSTDVHVHVPSPVLVPVHVPVSDGDGGAEEGETWPPTPATNRGHLWKLFTKAHITGTPSQRRQYFEAWLAQAGAPRLEQILMEPRIVGKDVFVIQRWYFNDMLKEAK